MRAVKDGLAAHSWGRSGEKWEGGVWPGALLARGTRTLRRCSFDARTRGSTRLPCEERSKRGGREGFRNVLPRCAQWGQSGCSP